MHDIWGPVVDMPVKFETVRRMALALEKIEEGTSYGTAAFKLKGVLFWRLHQDMESLVVRTDLEQREQMMAADPRRITSRITTGIIRGSWYDWHGFIRMRCGTLSGWPGRRGASDAAWLRWRSPFAGAGAWVTGSELQTDGA
jgi:hypothetical protein